MKHYIFEFKTLVIILLVALNSPSLFSQQVPLFNCPENEYTFTGTPEMTLCEEFPNFNCETEIGEGTMFPNSSSIGSSLSGYVCITGDLEIDEPFTFQNAIVKMVMIQKVCLDKAFIE